MARHKSNENINIYGTAEIYVRLFGTAQMIGFFFKD